MDIEDVVSRLAGQAKAIEALVTGISDKQARWKPDPASWSVLEVINHLWDEEREDFRMRIDYNLHRPGETWPPIDPAGWVTERRYNEGDPATSLQGFLNARETSLTWLQGLELPDWSASYEAPWGTITAGDLLAAWAAHDLLHIRQLVELRWRLAQAEMAPYSADYAGKW
jgi:hypothetical protein